MKYYYRALASCFSAGVVVNAGLISDDRVTKTLVLVDDWAIIETHSTFFDHIKMNLGHEVEYAISTDGPAGKVKHHDAYYFDNIIMMAPSTKGKSHSPSNNTNLLICSLENAIADGLSVDDFVEFLSDEAEHNLLLFANNESRRHTRKLSNSLGVDLEPYVSFIVVRSFNIFFVNRITS